ncbi:MULTISPECIES: LLM class flavin-dependent oxidoreductase [unclassified Ensifer]|uniref:LLM class flavin-dependent oxidoreductase n=1 Tax=unclassified Ensifer TaxID=2633371 RepID=UPI0007096483|nr:MULTISPECIES: LLM class flavin-dependent oxidoreductase [unclassified Ensifer]KQW33310.1 alkane 1-monooxygenase [Ensifer sp. Root1252]KQW80971.1 alkane 1-monooxygenase [Ensifer sp. Root127]KRC80817.1 alkane 1-monooxygenase [Ensifer sp. Root231]KRD02099.1 alkane 1-monooxygenase [Ensifer sp. Root258]
MSYLLSLLDKSPIDPGTTATDALQVTARLAAKAEEWGYHRFWLAEHHNMTGLASSAPETLIAYLLARTSKIRIGSGGVMLQHYSAYKVAETFNLLASLAPGRVDLGVGKAPGGFPLSTRALQIGIDPERKPGFAEQLSDLNHYLAPGKSEDGALLATPLPVHAPERFLLGASVESAELAAAKGWQLVFAAHLNGDPDNIERTVAAYERATGGGRPILAVAALAAESEERARERVAGLRIFKVFLGNGQSVNVGSEEQAAEFARQAGVSDYRVEEKSPSVLHGTPRQVRQELDALHRRYGVKEFVIDTPALPAAERFASIELIARERLSLVA